MTAGSLAAFLYILYEFANLLFILSYYVLTFCLNPLSEDTCIAVAMSVFWLIDISNSIWASNNSGLWGHSTFICIYKEKGYFNGTDKGGII